MNAKRQAKKILKLYGKSEYQARIDYMKGFFPEEPSYVGRIEWKHLGKRCLMIAFILTLTLAVAVVVASAFGVQLFGFNLFEYSDHTEISRDKEVVIEGETRFYKPTYVPEGYELINTDEFFDESIDHVYEDKQGNYLYIEQSAADSLSANVNNEDCVRENKEVDGMEILVYRYTDGSGSMWMFVKGKNYCDIYSILPDEEIEKIIKGLQ